MLTMISFSNIVIAENISILSGGDALAVFNLKIDQTAKDAVEAKEKAINEAKTQAFMSLARRILDEKEYKNFKAPDIDSINSLVRDFEIKDERVATNRYVANFTVRFNDNTIDFIRGNKNFFDIFKKQEDPIKKLRNIEKNVLILPYYKNFYGKNELWEEPNPWRDAWQALGGFRISSKTSIIIPTGDIEDVSFGSSQEIWDAIPEAINALKDKYKADEIIITRAFKKGKNLEIDIYSYDLGGFKLEKSIVSYMADNNFKSAIDDIIYDKDFFAELTNEQPKVDPQNQMKVVLNISMFFKDFREWMEVQKRINAITPKVEFKIKSLKNNEASIEIIEPSEAAHIELKDSLNAQGLMLTTPDYNYDGGYFSGNFNEVSYNYVLVLRD